MDEGVSMSEKEVSIGLDLELSSLQDDVKNYVSDLRRFLEVDERCNEELAYIRGAISQEFGRERRNINRRISGLRHKRKSVSSKGEDVSKFDREITELKEKLKNFDIPSQRVGLETSIINQKIKNLESFNEGNKFEILQLECNSGSNEDNELRKRIRERKNDSKTYFYITKVQEGDNPSHWFLVIQNGKSVYTVDSSGLNGFPENLYKMFVLTNDKEIKYLHNINRLQYSSGACETFAVKVAFYMLRLRIFNDISCKLGIITENRRGFALDSILEYGLSEQFLGRFKKDDKNDKDDRYELFEKRLNIADNNLDELAKEKQLYYSKSETFNKMFKEGIETDKENLRYVLDNYQASDDEIIDAVFDAIKNPKKDGTGVICTFSEEELKIAYDINKRSRAESKKIDNNNFRSFIKDECDMDFDRYTKIMSEFEKIRDTEEYYNSIKNKGKVDFYSRMCSIKSGFMLREAMKLKQKIEEADRGVVAPSK